MAETERVTLFGNSREILEKELGRVGINYKDCRKTNLWMHSIPKTTEDGYEEELEYHKNNLLVEMEGRKAILLMGRQPVEAILKEKIADVEGLQIPWKDSIMVVCKNPSIVLTQGAVIGNIRHAIERFGGLVRELNE